MRGLRRTLLLGCMALSLVLGQARGQTTSEPVHIASSLPLTGGSAWYGAQGRGGAELAVAEINEAGGVLGRKLDIDFWDNRCNPAEGVRSITQALADKHYTAVHDGGCSSVALAIMPLIQRAGIPYVVASPSATAITEHSGVGGNPFAFKIIPTDAGMLAALVNWISDKGQADKVAFIGEDTDYGRGGAAAFGAALAAHGKALISTDYYQQGTPDFTTLIARLQARKPSLIAAYLIGADSQNFLRQWQEAGGGFGLTGRIFTDQIPQEMLDSGVLDGLTTIHPYDVHRPEPANIAFVARYRAMFKTDPNLTSWASYEAVRVIAEAVRAAGTAEPGPVRDAIAKGRFKTIFGDTIAFDDHNLAHLDALILGVRDKHIVVLGKSPT
jgi:branched-chain amino acid transport system substrate-binding protein